LTRALRDLTFFQKFPELRLINVLDLGARPSDERPVYKEFAALFPCSILGIDVEPLLQDAFCNQFTAPSTARYISAFLGDGSDGIFHETLLPSTSSLNPPNCKVCAAFDGYEEAGTVLSTKRVTTTRVSELIHDWEVDLIKTDLQGSDLPVLKACSECVAPACALVIEFDFIAQYEGATPYWKSIAQLDELDFAFHSFLDFGTRPLAGFPLQREGPPRPYRQWLWANALFIRPQSYWPRLSGRKLLAMATLMHGLFKSSDYAWSLLATYDERYGTSISADFLSLLKEAENF
jgi:hypothetical protein